MHQHCYWKIVPPVPREDLVAILGNSWVSFLIGAIVDVVADDL